MKQTQFDPWDDAFALAHHVSQPGVRLAIVVGASQWCMKCSVIKPAFDEWLQRQENPSTTFLWLDLDEHSEFLGRFVPEDLPWLISYQNGKVVHQGLFPESPDKWGEVHLLQSSSSIESEDPGIWQRLVEADWAN